MKSNKIIATGLGLLVAVSGAFGLTACSSDDSSSSGGSTTAAADNKAADCDITEDLKAAQKAVADALAEDSSWAQIMLANDVKAPTVKYGLLVVPYTHSDAASKVQGTIAITDGKFTIEGTSAATSKVWVIDQDGKITAK